MQDICQIDLEKYEKITSSTIRGTSVVLTSERKNHIIEQRGLDEFYALFPHFSDVLLNPDYIFEDKDSSRINTVLVCKKIFEDGRYVNVVLRLAIESDDVAFKHSIITAMFRGAKSMRRTIRTHKLLYEADVN